MNHLPGLRGIALRSGQLAARSMAAGQVGQTRRMASDSSTDPGLDPNKKKELVLKMFNQFNHGAYVKQFGFPGFWSNVFRKLFLEYRMKSIDPKFNEELFQNECKEVGAFEDHL